MKENTDKKQYFGIDKFDSEDEVNYLKDLDEIYNKYGVYDEKYGLVFDGGIFKDNKKLSKELDDDIKLFRKKHGKFIDELDYKINKSK